MSCIIRPPDLVINNEPCCTHGGTCTYVLQEELKSLVSPCGLALMCRYATPLRSCHAYTERQRGREGDSERERERGRQRERERETEREREGEIGRDRVILIAG